MSGAVDPTNGIHTRLERIITNRAAAAARRLAVFATAIAAANVILACTETVTSPDLGLRANDGTLRRRNVVLRTTTYDNGRAVSQMKSHMLFTGRSIDGLARGSLALLEVQTASSVPPPMPAGSDANRPGVEAQRYPRIEFRMKAADSLTIGTSLGSVPRMSSSAAVVEEDFANLAVDLEQLAYSRSMNTTTVELPLHLSAADVTDMLTTQATSAVISSVDHDSSTYFPLAPGNPSSDTYLFKDGRPVAAVYTNFVPATGGWDLDNMMLVGYDSAGVVSSTAVFMVVNGELEYAATDGVLDEVMTLAVRSRMLAARVVAPRDAIAQVNCWDYMVHAGFATAGALISVAMGNPLGAMFGMGSMAYHTVRFAHCKEQERRSAGGHLPPCHCVQPI